MTDNRDHYYLRDAMGGHLGLIVDDDGDNATPGHAAFTTYDAFGNVMARVNAASGAFAWRGGEGSVTDRHPGLVYMQARHYDPKIGRFIQADTVLLASMTTQGMNRYAYAENDPVSMSDPTGRHPIAGFILLALVFAAAFLLGSFALSVFGLAEAQRGACILIGGEETYDAYLDFWGGRNDFLIDAIVGLTVTVILAPLGVAGLAAILIGLLAAFATDILIDHFGIAMKDEASTVTPDLDRDRNEWLRFSVRAC